MVKYSVILFLLLPLVVVGGTFTKVGDYQDAAGLYPDMALNIITENTPCIEIKPDGNPIIVWSVEGRYTESGRWMGAIYSLEYNGNSWVVPSGSSNTEGGLAPSTCSKTFGLASISGLDGKPAFFWFIGTASDLVFSAFIGGAQREAVSWAGIGNSLSSTGISGSYSHVAGEALGADFSQGAPIVVWQQKSGNPISCKRFNGSAWIDINGADDFDSPQEIVLASNPKLTKSYMLMQSSYSLIYGYSRDSGDWAALPTALSYGTIDNVRYLDSFDAVVLDDGELYILYGAADTSPSGVNLSWYDDNAGAWTTSISPLNSSYGNNLKLFQIGSKLIAFSSSSDASRILDMAIFDPETRTWDNSQQSIITAPKDLYTHTFNVCKGLTGNDFYTFWCDQTNLQCYHLILDTETSASGWELYQ
jgi:hypothetical protein